MASAQASLSKEAEYLITTGNGALLRTVGRSNWTAQASSQLGYTAFEVQPDQIRVKAINTYNRVYDEAAIAG